MKPASTIFLIGMPGCGKSHLGKMAAQKMNAAFIDFDDYIEQQEGKTIAQIFEEASEAGFRLLERKCLRELTESGGQRIIALGGGTPCFFDNIQLINDTGLSVYLKVPIDELVKRLLPFVHKRPLLKGKRETELREYLKKLLKKREPFYRQANLIIDISDHDADTFFELLKQHWAHYK